MRLAAALLAGAALAALAVPASAQGTLYDVLAKATPHSCPRGKEIVKAYKRKDGAIVRGYCKDNPTQEPIGLGNPAHHVVMGSKDNPQQTPISSGK